MPTQLQFRRYSSDQIANITGKIGEIFLELDTDNFPHKIRLSDGVTKGAKPLKISYEDIIGNIADNTTLNDKFNTKANQDDFTSHHTGILFKHDADGIIYTGHSQTNVKGALDSLYTNKVDTLNAILKNSSNQSITSQQNTNLSLSLRSYDSDLSSTLNIGHQTYAGTSGVVSQLSLFGNSGNSFNLLVESNNIPGSSGTLQLKRNDAVLLSTNDDNDIIVENNLHVKGDITFGAYGAPVDTITVNADFSGDLIPIDSNEFDLGSTSKKWKELNVNKVNINNYSLPTVDGSAGQAIVTNGDGTTSFQDVSSATSSDIISSYTIGAITAGETIPSNSDLETVLRQIFTSVFYPTFYSTPTITLTASNTTREIGSNSNITLNASYSAGQIRGDYTGTSVQAGATSGSWDPNKVQISRAGAAIDYTYRQNGTIIAGAQDIPGNSYTLSGFFINPGTANNLFNVTVEYGQGGIAKSSDGLDYDSAAGGQNAYPAGTITSSNATIEGILPWFWQQITDIADINTFITNPFAVGTYTKSVAKSTGEVTVPINTSLNAYVVVLLPTNTQYSTNKTKWYVNALNNGSIGANGTTGDAVQRYEDKSLDSPTSLWSNQLYDVYIADKSTWASFKLQN